MSDSHAEMKREVVGMFDRAAPLYGQVGTKQFTYFAHLLVERLAIPPGSHILDVATGRGALLFAAAEKIGDAGRVIGIDLAPAMVEETRAEILQQRLSGVSVALMDADAPAFEPARFDVITCGFALHFLDYERTLPRLRTLLKPGGIFAAAVPNPPFRDEDRALWGWLFDLTKAVFPPDFVPPPAWIAPRSLRTPERAEAALTAAGFAPVWTEQHEATLYFRDADDWWDFEWSQGSRFWLEGMSQPALERFEREARAHLRAMQTPQGIPMHDGALFIFGRRP